MIELLIQVSGKRPEVTNDAPRDNDIRRSVLDDQAAVNELNWQSALYVKGRLMFDAACSATLMLEKLNETGWKGPCGAMINKKVWLSIAMILCVAGMLMFTFLGTHPLLDPDEPVYAETAREMLQSQDFISPPGFMVISGMTSHRCIIGWWQQHLKFLDLVNLLPAFLRLFSR